ncbi:LOW QUALITY PROTEIN: hypothetical protein RJ639_032127 [Escallonia herrerae]|uniref:Retrotransposon gag domain-containing protein n=1 Tax=Escallonia herrerae TaxID=1293975 RepID=A0AA88X1M9_9ASTE|nr:LOW QUALITY PROTEIN: hypothetical protein RJ639_032127 [Escallonia herrerae]
MEISCNNRRTRDRNVEPPNVTENENLPDLLTLLANQQAQLTQLLANQQAQLNQQNNLTHLRIRILEPFGGTDDPIVEKKWISPLERPMGCTDAKKIELTVCKLDGEADHWGKMIEDNKTAEQRKAMTWVQFKVLFFDRCFPRSVKEQMYRDFLNLRQEDNESVAEYECVDIAKTIEFEARDFKERKEAKIGKRDHPKLSQSHAAQNDGKQKQASLSTTVGQRDQGQS